MLIAGWNDDKSSEMKKQIKGGIQMAIFLDSANLEDVRTAAELGFVHGATTNPKLMAAAGHKDFTRAMAV